MDPLFPLIIESLADADRTVTIIDLSGQYTPLTATIGLNIEDDVNMFTLFTASGKVFTGTFRNVAEILLSKVNNPVIRMASLS